MKHLFQKNRIYIITLITILVLISGAATIVAQEEADQLPELTVELWPDYDRPSMLVLLTGALPPDFSFPATITIPMPPDADINAVARIDNNGALMADVEYAREGDALTMTLPDPRFRVEYYVDYTADGDSRAYEFDWLSDLDVGSLSVIVQQPVVAGDLNLSPIPVSAAADRGDGLLYHVLGARPVAAGEPYRATVSYDVLSPGLSAGAQAPAAVELPAAAATAAETGGGSLEGFDWRWALAALGVVALVGLAWFIGRRQGSTRPTKPQPRRTGGTAAANQPAPSGSSPRFCHNCGQPAKPNDQFCRHCGTQLKASA